MAKGLQHGGRRVKGKEFDKKKGIWVWKKKETKKTVASNKKIAIASPVVSVGKPGKWICHRCTVHNEQSITRCTCCGARKPRISTAAEHNASASPTNKNKISVKNGKGKLVMEKPHFQSSGTVSRHEQNTFIPKKCLSHITFDRSTKTVFLHARPERRCD